MYVEMWLVLFPKRSISSFLDASSPSPASMARRRRHAISREVPWHEAGEVRYPAAPPWHGKADVRYPATLRGTWRPMCGGSWSKQGDVRRFPAREGRSAGNPALTSRASCQMQWTITAHRSRRAIEQRRKPTWDRTTPRTTAHRSRRAIRQHPRPMGASMRRHPSGLTRHQLDDPALRMEPYGAPWTPRAVPTATPVNARPQLDTTNPRSAIMRRAPSRLRHRVSAIQPFRAWQEEPSCHL